ncbi:hypothetical protein GCM10008995_13720 [Halobellus salinus]|uniref:DUF8103 domain-containing protein n=1 Tax=Halobellus salinus TaxID=931585 RepID=A0A830EEV1_9EURY|nr:hypothetical protein [Halobellus salinus]GGJ05133.1 hypothetical protein GCM10008995_13720 [Halobellus salinus]SMP23018.1 hypothetical protein SAMN06265347_10918 [Halobellus salinus]
MSHQQEEACPPADELPENEDVDWTILRSMLAASNETSQAMESHLLRVYYSEGEDSQVAQTEEHLERAIARHERIIENLGLAKKMVDRRG